MSDAPDKGAQYCFFPNCNIDNAIDTRDLFNGIFAEHSEFPNLEVTIRGRTGAEHILVRHVVYTFTD